MVKIFVIVYSKYITILSNYQIPIQIYVSFVNAWDYETLYKLILHQLFLNIKILPNSSSLSNMKHPNYNMKMFSKNFVTLKS